MVREKHCYGKILVCLTFILQVLIKLLVCVWGSAGCMIRTDSYCYGE